MKLETILRNDTAFAAFMCGQFIEGRDNWMYQARGETDPDGRRRLVGFARTSQRNAIRYLRQLKSDAKATQP